MTKTSYRLLGLSQWLSRICLQRRRHRRGGCHPWVGRSPGRINGDLLQYSCLKNSRHRGAWRVTVHGVTKSQTRLCTTLPGSVPCDQLLLSFAPRSSRATLLWGRQSGCLECSSLTFRAPAAAKHPSYCPGLPWRFAIGTAKSLQSCPTLCNPIDGSPPGSPVPGILQARTLEWVVISFSNA